MMYRFSRRVRLAPGNTQQALSWARETTEKVSQVTGLDVSLFQRTFSPEIGTMVWTTTVDSLAKLEAAQDKIEADSGFLKFQDQGAQYFQQGHGVDDHVRQILHNDQKDPLRQSEYATTVETVITNGMIERGLELGVEIAQQVEKTVGLPTQFMASLSGSYGRVMWLTGYGNIREFEQAQQKLQQSTQFQQFVDTNVPDVYIDNPQETRQLIYRRLI